jgi:uncharacterized membrane protein YdjX (TVP38/TMEM64 family)
VSNRLRWIVTALLLTAAAVAVLITVRSRFAAYVLDFLEFVRGLGPWAPLVLAAAYILATVLLLPGFVLTLAAGFLFGPFVGTITVSAGSVLGASLAFLLGRTIARHAVERRIAGNERFQALDEAVGKSGFKIVLLTRLSPVLPFNVLNYALSLTKVSLSSYVLASWIGMLPATALYVYVGSTLQSLASAASGEVEHGPAGYLFFGVGLVATIAVTIILTRIATRALKRHVHLSEPA